jgi:ABC-type multidrug transport system fused ATPase/permease subunit
VLNGLTCTLAAREKIGIVGRTGAGKTTFVQSLFRLVEPADGAILIDGVSIGDIGLEDLRSRLAVVPQDPGARPSPSPTSCVR